GRITREKDPAGETEVAVEPGVGERAAVDLHAELQISLVHHLRQRLDAEVRRVGVRADHPEARLGRGTAPDTEGEDRTAAADEIAPLRLQRPARALLEFGEARCLEAARRLRDAVVRRGAFV